MVRKAWAAGSRGSSVALALPPAVAFAQYPPAEPSHPQDDAADSVIRIDVRCEVHASSGRSQPKTVEVVARTFGCSVTIQNPTRKLGACQMRVVVHRTERSQDYAYPGIS
jgi:hypothetical protein